MIAALIPLIADGLDNIPVVGKAFTISFHNVFEGIFRPKKLTNYSFMTNIGIMNIII